MKPSADRTTLIAYAPSATNIVRGRGRAFRQAKVPSSSPKQAIANVGNADLGEIERFAARQQPGIEIAAFRFEVGDGADAVALLELGGTRLALLADQQVIDAPSRAGDRRGTRSWGGHERRTRGSMTA